MGYNKHKVDSQNTRIVDSDNKWFKKQPRPQPDPPPSTVTEAGTTSPPSTTPSYGHVTRA